ncbi:hypothetical protein V3C99_008816 [Haemonchus contortus]
MCASLTAAWERVRVAGVYDNLGSSSSPEYPRKGGLESGWNGWYWPNMCAFEVECPEAQVL